MPFHEFTWRDKDTWGFDLGKEPTVDLRQKESETFVLLKSFCYLVPDWDPDAGTVYVVPGSDGPGSWSDTRREERDGHPVVFPPNPNGGETDLASVPWFMWWLVATYGNHTQAALLHDALVVEKGEGELPIPRTAADRLLLTALRERGQKTGVFRHWLMWAAVGVFGTMGRLRGALFSAHVLLFWTVLVTAIVASWGRTIWSWGSSLPPLLNALVIAVAAFLVVGGLLWLLGGAWRLGKDNTIDWWLPIIAVATLIVVLLLLELPWDLDFESSSVNWLLLAAAVLLFAGLLWRRAVDRSLSGWLWPTALIGLPIALLPVGLIFASVYLVWFIDDGAARIRSLQRDEDGERLGYDKPEVKPTHFPI